MKISPSDYSMMSASKVRFFLENIYTDIKAKDVFLVPQALSL
jgi:hypothetical protein